MSERKTGWKPVVLGLGLAAGALAFTNSVVNDTSELPSAGVEVEPTSGYLGSFQDVDCQRAEQDFTPGSDTELAISTGKRIMELQTFQEAKTFFAHYGGALVVDACRGYMMPSRSIDPAGKLFTFGYSCEPVRSLENTTKLSLGRGLQPQPWSDEGCRIMREPYYTVRVKPS